MFDFLQKGSFFVAVGAEDDVQYVVASKVGREPVRYVGNIYKYYLAYRRLRELEAERDRTLRGIDGT